MKWMLAFSSALGLTCLVAGCTKSPPADAKPSSLSGGYQSGEAACRGLIDSINAERWDSAAAAILPSQRAAAAAWIAGGLLNALAVVDAALEPDVDPVKSRERFQNIWTTAAVGPGFLSDLQAVLDSSGRPVGVERLESMAQSHLGRADTTRLIALCLIFEAELLGASTPAQPEMGSLGRAKMVAPGEADGARESLGLRANDYFVVTSSCVLKPMPSDGVWYLQIVAP